MAQKGAQPIATVEHIPQSEHGRGFPPFDAQTFASQLFWLALAFVGPIGSQRYAVVLLMTMTDPRRTEVLERIAKTHSDEEIRELIEENTK